MDIYYISIRLAVIGFLLLCSAIFSSSETALFSLNRLQLLKLKEEGHPKFRILHSLLSKPRQLLISLIMGNEFSNIAATTIATSIAITMWGEMGKWMAFWIMVTLVLIFGDIIPRSIALLSPIDVSVQVSKPISFFVETIRPLRRIVKIVVDRIIRIFHIKSVTSQPSFLENDFLRVVESIYKEGILEETESNLIRRAIGFSYTKVGEIMVPRMDMFTIPVDIDLKDLIAAVKTHYFSRIPVYDSNPDDITGILHAKDILAIDPLKEVWNKERFKSLLHPPYFVPISKKAEVLFAEFQAKRIHMGIILDEYGGVSGLVTMEDLLEELFGEIYDEFDKAEVKYKKLDSGHLLISPRLSIEDFNALMKSDIPSDGLETMGGFVFSLFGRIPTPGEKVVYQNLTFIATKVKGSRILEIKVEKVGTEG